MTETQAQIPSVDPVDLDSLVGAFRFILKKFLQQSVDGMLPAKVIAYDPTTNRATVQPMIKIATTSGEEVSRAQLASIPVYQMGNSQFQLTFAIQPGDLGWIMASDRDISLYLQTAATTVQTGAAQYTEAPPNTARLHNFSDAVFFPDAMNNAIPAAVPGGGTVWQSKDATTYISMILGKIIFQAITMTATGNFQVYGLTELHGGLNGFGDTALSGKFACNGATPQAKITVNAPAVTSGDVIALVNQLRAALIAYGICQ